MSTFALIHGGMHGGWCWELLTPLLERRGHRVVAPDLPIDEEVGARAWADVVADAVGPDAGEDVIVVGHSLGGLAVPVVGSLIPLRRMVFLCAQVPVPAVAYADYLATEPEAVTFPFDRVSFGDDGQPIVPLDVANEVFYPDCPEPVARRAFERLRGQSTTVFTEICPIDRWPDVPVSYVYATDDRAVGPSWSVRVARERLGVEPIAIPGSHSPFYSRPETLAEVLAGV